MSLEIPADYPAVSRETLEKLRHYHALLLKWQEKINLISPATVREAWERHFLDSLQIAPLLPIHPANLYDLGSGAGFSGMVLAIVRPDLKMTLIESDSKKCAFLQTVSRETATPVTIENGRIESVSLPPPDVVTARALAALPALLDYTAPWLETGVNPRLIFAKGEQYKVEIAAAHAAGWAFDCLETPSKTETGAAILTLTNVCRSAR